jgi:hypothetical protein
VGPWRKGPWVLFAFLDVSPARRPPPGVGVGVGWLAEHGGNGVWRSWLREGKMSSGERDMPPQNYQRQHKQEMRDIRTGLRLPGRRVVTRREEPVLFAAATGMPISECQ